MSWVNIEERMAESLSRQIPFPAGLVRLPTKYMNVAEWLASIAHDEQERRDLSVDPMKFLRYRWPFAVLVEMLWDDIGATIMGDYTIEAMFVGNRAFLFLSKPSQHQVVAAIEPADQPQLYAAAVGALLSNPDAIAEPPTRFICHRPDLVANSVVEHAFSERNQK